MKNRLGFIAVAAAVVLGFSGCSKSEKKGTVSKAETKTAKTYKIAMISDTSIADGGWGAACYNAMVSAAKAEDFETQYTDNITTADFTTSIRSYCSLGFDVIFAPGNQYSDAVKEVAADFPNVKFILLNGTIETANIVSVLPDAKQIGYMAGALAGLMSKTNSIGFIGGVELDTTKQKLECYEAAAKKVNPAIKCVSAYAGSFSDSAKGMEIAEAMVTTSDVDVMFGDASAVDSGARQALEKHTDRYDIGQPADLLKVQESPVVICSVVTDNAAMIKVCLEDVKNNTFGNKTVYGNLSNGCLSVGTFSSKVNEDVKAEYLDIIKKISDGTFLDK